MSVFVDTTSVDKVWHDGFLYKFKTHLPFRFYLEIPLPLIFNIVITVEVNFPFERKSKLYIRKYLREFLSFCMTEFFLV